MPVPKKRTSKSKKGMRRSHHALSVPAFSECPECSEMKRPHMVCPECGHYKDKEILEIDDA